MAAPATTPAPLTRPGRRIVTVAAVLVLFALLVAVYRPSFGHIPRADHWWYLHQTRGHNDFVNVFARTWSYNRTLCGGDYGLFRPVFFALFALEKHLFGHDWAWWQRVGVGLHAAVVGLFLLLVRRLLALRPDAGLADPAPFPLVLLGVALAAFFALNLSVVEMVVWSHINPYMFALALDLGAMLLILEVLASPDDPGRRTAGRLALAWVCLLAAAFTHETGQFFAVIVAAVLARAAVRRGRPRRAALLFAAFAAIFVLYQAADRLDQHVHPPTREEPGYGTLLQHATAEATGRNTARYLLFTLVQPFVPEGLAWRPRPRGWTLHSRMGFSEPWTRWPEGLRPGPLLAASLAAGLLVAARSTRPLTDLAAGRAHPAVRLFLVLPAGLAALHLAATVLGRLNLRPEEGTLTNSPYYAYPPLLLFLLTLFALWAGGRRGRWTGRLEWGLVAALACLTPVEAARTYRLNATIRDDTRALRAANDTLLGLVRAHRRDPAFSFRIEPDCRARLEHYQGRPFPEILYPEYLNADAPTHLIVLDRGRPRAVPAPAPPLADTAASLPAGVRAVP